MNFFRANELAALDKVCMSVSLTSLGLTILCGILRRCGIHSQIDMLSSCFLPVATAAAVGYLTNYAAIWLLFKPYHPVRWLHDLQGVIPKQQRALAATLGKEIPENLLPPDELVARLNEMVAEYLDNPELVADIRRKAIFYALRQKAGIAAVVVPYIESAVAAALEKSVTPENVKELYDLQLEPWIRRQLAGEKISKMIAGELQTRVPDITSSIRRFVRSGAQEYVQTEYPTLSNWIHADEFAARMVTRLNWAAIREKIADVISEPSTRSAIRAELSALAEKLREYIHSREFGRDAIAYCTDGKTQIIAGLHTYLTENLPDAIEKFIQQDEIWENLKREIIPTLKAFIAHHLKRDKAQIIAGMDLSGRIEGSIMAQTPETIHAMVNRISGEHLVLLQLLGYFLGGIAGGMLAFAQ